MLFFPGFSDAPGLDEHKVDKITHVLAKLECSPTGNWVRESRHSERADLGDGAEAGMTVLAVVVFVHLLYMDCYNV